VLAISVTLDGAPVLGRADADPVVSGGTSYSANCAWDAYGIAAMIDRDTQCVARCPDCGDRMDLSVKRGAVGTKGMVHFVVPPRRFWDNVAFT
jgi:hypothetical protein